MKRQRQRERRSIFPLGVLILIGCTWPLVAAAAAAPSDELPRELSLDEAVRIARARQPQLRQAHAQSEVAAGRADQARAPLLPQLGGTASYLRFDYSTNGSAVASSGGGGATVVGASAPTVLSAGATASQLIFDFGQNWSKWRGAQATERAQRETEQATGMAVILNVRTAFFGARANKALVGVAREALENQNRHLAQVQAFVEVGTRPEIDLAQARSDQATAELQLINAQSNYATARAQLRQAMGVDGTADFDVTDETLAPVAGEDARPEALTDQALAARPEMRSLAEQLRAAELAIRAVKGSFGPALSLTGGASYRRPDGLPDSWVLNGGLSLSWALLEGGLERGRLHEDSANLDNLRAGVDLQRQQITLEVEQARLALTSSKAAIVAADKALTNARERLRLAEARYQTGVGNAVELGDAQLALTNAGVQKLQAEFQLGVARAQLLKALGQG
ncbi:MAG TPA: TolC family protein [Polyangia bacterium]|nr:TolC family protein [Polyangia bacterium]